MNAAAIFICMWVKLKLNKQLEKCMASINASLMKHKIILGLDDRGRLSCHKVNLCFIYFDPTLEVCQDDVPHRDLETYSDAHLHGCNLVDPDLNGGELNIR